MVYLRSNIENNTNLPNNTTLYENDLPWYKSPPAVFIYVLFFLICMCGCPSNSSNTNKISTQSGTAPRPLPNIDSASRVQRLRLSAVGGGSSRLKNENDRVSFKPEDHKNVVNNAIYKVRGGGAAFVPKRDSIPAYVVKN